MFTTAHHWRLQLTNSLPCSQQHTTGDFN